jgi:GNAT superfamily N-acetyltransferase
MAAPARSRRAGLEVRRADPTDLTRVFWFLRRKAAFDRGELRATRADLARALFGKRPRCGVLLAERGGKPEGFAFYFETYSSFQGGPCLWLDDLYVVPEARGKGAGTALLRGLARIARRRGCARIDWTVSLRNGRSLRFYRGRGARIKPGVRLCRLDAGEIRELAGEGIAADANPR